MTSENFAISACPNPSPWRRALKTAVSALLMEAGYQAADCMALETLLEMTQAYITEAGRSSSTFAELSGRTQVMVSDVVMALVEMGTDFTAIPKHARRENKINFLPPVPSTQTPVSKILQVGEKKKHPLHIPDHLPAFPDPHTYIKTQCYKQPANEYQLVREKAASQKRDVEVALTRFIAKTGATHSLFKDDKSSFPLIACKPTPMPSLAGLLPADSQITDQEKSESDGSVKLKQQAQSVQEIGADAGADMTPDAEAIDNPYLIPAKIAKSKWS
ncbi:transcription initiation factor tfiid subunit 8 [Plakobranchus ocellatus]|uniref:Transcription initiation factor TFIID subunit 8 n=1 Tax=Plakobranchus ocellatus TaxID=259542 RepID=A0AAV4B388_9GAST|nr:transcription initiation factor tfiid subunit 8 [Plakobranchus ocellatus]